MHQNNPHYLQWVRTSSGVGVNWVGLGPMTWANHATWEGTLARQACTGQSFNSHCPTSNHLGACVSLGFSDLA